MPETPPEVEKILSEIRQKTQARKPMVANSIEPQEETDVLIKVGMNLTVTALSWDKLPPINSDRSGILSHLEIWVKSKFKKITNWFTWEQVRFNEAVHLSLVDLHKVLVSQELILMLLMEQNVAKSESILPRENLQPSQKQEYLQFNNSQLDVQKYLQRILDEQSVHYQQLSNRINETGNAVENIRFDFERRMSELKKNNN